MPRSTLLLVATLPLGLPALAQGTFPLAETDDIPLALDEHPAPFQAVDVGRILGFDDYDGIFLQDGDLRMAPSIGRFDSIVQIAAGISAATVYPSSLSGLPGVTDLVVTSDASGLKTWMHLPGLGVIPVLTPINLPSLAGISEFELGDFDPADNEGFPDLLFVAGDATDRVESWALVSGHGFLPRFIHTHTEVPIDLAALDWNADGVDEYALLSDGSLTIYDVAGKVVDVLDPSTGGGSLVALHTDEQGMGDSLVWIRDGAGSVDELVVLHPNEPQFALPLELSYGGVSAGLQVVGARAADADGDGHPDLLLSLANWQAGVVMFDINGGGPPEFKISDGAYRVFPYTATPTAQPASTPPVAAFVDIDGEGRADILAPSVEASALVFQRLEVEFLGGEGDLAGGGLVPGTNGTGTGLVAVDEAGLTSSSPGWTGQHVLYLDVPSDIPIANFDHVQVQVWRSLPGQSPVPLFNDVFAFPDQGGTPDPEVWRHTAVRIPTLAGPLLEDWLAGDHRFVAYRLMNATPPATPGGPPTIHSVGRWFKFGLAYTPDLANWLNEAYMDPLRSLRFYQAEREITEYQEQTGGDLTGITLGIAVDLGRIPDIEGLPTEPPPIRYVTTQGSTFTWDPYQ